MSRFEIPGARFVDGEYLMSNVTDESLERLKTFRVVPGDILLATYPKTGTTWMQELLWLVWSGGDISGAKSSPVYHRVPFIEFKIDGFPCPLDQLESIQGPRLIKTHLRADHFMEQIKQGHLKVIVVTRNPKDTLVSYYNFYKLGAHLWFGGFSGSFDDFFQLHQEKMVSYGNYFEWHEHWLPLKNLPNVLLVKYEDMKKDLPEVISRVETFTGKPLPDDVKDEIVQHLSFKSMKDNKMTNFSLIPNLDVSKTPVIRKGEIGDWKNYFSQEQSELIDREYEKRVLPLGVNMDFE